MKTQIENDLFRTTLGGAKPGRLVVTKGVHEDIHLDQIVEAVRTFKDFSENNDPHGEHDFGKITIDGRDYLWKIDYYAMNEHGPDFNFGADPETSPCYRILTIMRSDEY